ncbi:LysR family transcriptional regulator [Streptomyces sp. AC536]|uniref:LysR substrate-binding domain-containing protein n=1 Tax=Streptomyces buecherae TaxID=2763006 RepID=UPI00164D98E6|nr:LysR substrate-binding domain-containing protein [Streptomyces buecherae]MBC3982204.1 LysR family transcriptional regulator [Streptomyces buecherae]QNJ43487.1 LysR family transcriptional regulator [Streptomyces buecherae]
MLDVRRLRLLRELALRGTIAAVAEALAFTPSAVSQQLSALEREAGVPLLERTGRRVTLTPAGQRLVPHAEAVLERLELAAAELVDARQGLAGPLRIGTFPTAARAILPAALVALADRHPRLEPMLSEVDPAAVADALRAGELDVALVHDYDFVPSLAEPGLATEPLCAEAMYLASLTPPDAPAATPVGARGPTGACAGATGPGGAPACEGDGGPGLARWRDATWITATPGTLCHAMTIRACQAAGFAPRVRHQVDEFATVLALVAAGQGVALVPQLGLVHPPPQVTLAPMAMSRRTRIAFRSGAGRHPAVAAVAAALRAVVAEDAPDGHGGPRGPLTIDDTGRATAV